MLKDPKGPLPRMHVLRVFEAAGRLSSFVRAAEELGTHQPAVSRYIAELEYEIGVQLFERGNRYLSLTSAGKIYHRRVSAALEHIADSALTAASGTEAPIVTVACTHAFSHQIMMPRFKTLRQTLGGDIGLHILTADYSILERIGENDADLIITYDKTAVTPKHRVTLFTEAFTPVCSPEFAAAHTNVLSQPVKEWGSLPFLRYPDAHDWATWHDWFEFAGHPTDHPRFISIGDYVYLIEAAIDGQGLALGWRHYTDHYLNNGMLVALSKCFVERNRNCYIRLTKRGRLRQIARRCLDAFGSLDYDTLSDSPPS